MRGSCSLVCLCLLGFSLMFGLHSATSPQNQTHSSVHYTHHWLQCFVMLLFLLVMKSLFHHLIRCTIQSVLWPLEPGRKRSVSYCNFNCVTMNYYYPDNRHIFVCTVKCMFGRFVHGNIMCASNLPCVFRTPDRLDLNTDRLVPNVTYSLPTRPCTINSRRRHCVIMVVWWFLHVGSRSGEMGGGGLMSLDHH